MHVRVHVFACLLCVSLHCACVVKSLLAKVTPVMLMQLNKLCLIDMYVHSKWLIASPRLVPAVKLKTSLSSSELTLQLHHPSLDTAATARLLLLGCCCSAAAARSTNTPHFWNDLGSDSHPQLRLKLDL